MTKSVLLIWLAGMPGVLAVSFLALPLLLEGHPMPAPPFVVSIASAMQSAVLLALAAWTGVKLAPHVALHAPVLSGAAHGRIDTTALRAQLLPGTVGGMLGVAILVAFVHFAPPALALLQDRFSLPLAVRVLYGGITEEILVRWGLMTLLAWAFWRIFQKGSGEPAAFVLWAAILLSAVAFGALHLPMAAAMLGPAPGALSFYIVVANAAFGIVAGFLFWRHGLEAAMLAHVIAHVIAQTEAALLQR